MKKAILILLFLPIIAAAQTSEKVDSIINKLPFDESGHIVYSEVVETKLSKDQLFKNAQTWIAKNYGDYKKVIQVEDLATGNIVFKGRSIADQSGNDITSALAYTIQLDFKPMKFRIRISDIKDYYYLTFMPVDKREKSVPLEDYYKTQLARKDEYAKLVPSQINKKDLQLKALLQEIRKALISIDDF